MAENTLTNVTNPQPRAEETRNGNFFTPRVDIVETENALYLYADCTKPRCPHRKIDEPN